MSTNSKIVCLADQRVADYSRVASEYYDAIRHPTSAAFGRASVALIAEFLSRQGIKLGAHVCDVGAGKSVVAHLLGDQLAKLGSLWLVDNTQAMLDWSRCFESQVIHRQVMNASEIDTLGVRFDLIVASLGDPYNTIDFWRAVESALAPQGTCVFTTPSYQWATAYRQRSVQECENTALFALGDGAVDYVPSLIFPEADQCRLIEKSGLVVDSIKRVIHKSGQDQHLPPKLEALEEGQPIVVSYVVDRVA